MVLRRLFQRRRFQFSMGTLLIAVTAISVWLGVQVHRANRQRQAVAAIARLGGWLRYDYQFVDGNFDPQAESPVPSWLRGWLHTDLVDNVVEVNMVYNTDAPRRIDNDILTDEALQHVAAFPKLRTLLLNGTQATDDALLHLRHLKYLEQIYIWDASEVGDSGIRQLEGLKRLKQLHVSDGRLTDEALRTLGKLPVLEKLSLQGNRFTDRGLKHLAGSTSLQSLWLGLGETSITDEGLPWLYGLKRLKQVEFQRSPVTREGVFKLRQALPDVEIIHEFAQTGGSNPQPAADSNAPTLQFVSWQHQPPQDPQAPLEGIYWQPGGDVVDDQELLAPLRHRRWGTPSSTPGGPRYLHMFVSYPRLAASPYGQVHILHVNGRTIHDTLRAVTALSTGSAATGAGFKWQYFQVHMAEGVKLPKKALVRLRYATGDWQRMGAIPAGAEPGHRPVAGTTLVSLGQALDGTSQVSLYVDEQTSGKFQFQVSAVDPEGRQRPDWSVSALTIAPPGSSAVFTFKFSQPLSATNGFELVGREIQVAEFHDVVLQTIGP